MSAVWGSLGVSARITGGGAPPLRAQQALIRETPKGTCPKARTDDGQMQKSV